MIQNVAKSLFFSPCPRVHPLLFIVTPLLPPLLPPALLCIGPQDLIWSQLFDVHHFWGLEVSGSLQSGLPSQCLVL